MQVFFEPTSYQLANGKWTPSFNRIIQSGPHTNMQESSWDRQFDTEKEANEYATGYCLKEGYIPVDKK